MSATQAGLSIDMLTLLCLIAVVVLFGAHEFLVVRLRAPRRYAGVARRVLLLGLVASAVVFGARAQLFGRLQSALDAWSGPSNAFGLSGDPLARAALAAQRPERPFPSGGSAQDVQFWQSATAERLRSLSEYPRTTEPAVETKVLGTEDVGDIRRTLLEFTSFDGTRVPAYVHQPAAGGANRPAILVIPGHGGGIRATAGIEPDYQHGVALELATRGYITLTPELRGFGMLAPKGMPAHRIVAHAALSAGSFYKAIVARDLRLALTVLQQWDGVDATRLAVAGTSLGGELAVFLGGLDPRARVIVSHSYGGTAGAESVSEAAVDDAEQTPHGCHTIPGINRVLYLEDWFRLLAPRAVQVVRGSGNVGQPAKVEVFEAAAAEAFARFGARERFEFLIEPGEHEFFVEPAARFLAKWL